PSDALPRSNRLPEVSREADGRVPSGGRPGQQVIRAKETPERRRLVPEHVRKKFVQVGKHYYFADGARAFSDRGQRLTSPSENTEVVRSLVAIAEARGWSEITVRGTARFRKEAWFAARLAGLEVRGYRPSKFERAHLVRTISRDKGGMKEEPDRGALSGLKRREQSRDVRGQDSRPDGAPARQVRQGG